VCEVGARGSLLASSAVGDRSPMVLRLTNEALLPQPPREGTRWVSHGPGGVRYPLPGSMVVVAPSPFDGYHP
jgi:hypothetical protein